MHISRRSLNKLFQRNGVGVMEYVMLQRLERAARDLSSPSQRMVPISQIAYRWGFKNISHFCKRFRDRFGQAPGEVRGR
jgi:AraC-like DNA-binding protein